QKNFPFYERGGEKVVRRRNFLAAILGDGGRHAHNNDVGGGNDDVSAKDPPRRSTSQLSSIVQHKRRPDANSAVESPQPPLDEAPNSPEGSSTSSWRFPFPLPARQAGSTAAGTLAWAPAVMGSQNRRRQRCVCFGNFSEVAYYLYLCCTLFY
ncbi:Os12g0458900, partial [Oryza sativa Japonica Group]